jgi:hypothetical protein
MKRLFRATAFVVVLAGAITLLTGAAASAGPPAGTWTLYPAQTDTAGTPTTDTTSVYQTAVRPPINADGSSNWPAKRGVVPVQFDLLAGTKTVTTTPHTVGPVVFQSIFSNNPDTIADDYSYLVLDPTASLTFADVDSLVANYTFDEGDCYGGSLRWTINVQHDGTARNVYVYYGIPNGPNQECTSSAANGSGENLMDESTAVTPDRFEFEGAGAPVYTTYSAMLGFTNNGTDTVNWVGLMLDSGWKDAPNSDQRVTLGAVTVNDNTFVPRVNYTDVSAPVFGPLAKTCDLPAAEIRWAKDDGTPSGGVNEDLSVQPKDTGQFYRQVDCKYIYNLDVSKLAGAGTYEVWANIDGASVDNSAVFDLR